MSRDNSGSASTRGDCCRLRLHGRAAPRVTVRRVATGRSSL